MPEGQESRHFKHTAMQERLPFDLQGPKSWSSQGDLKLRFPGRSSYTPRGPPSSARGHRAAFPGSPEGLCLPNFWNLCRPACRGTSGEGVTGAVPSHLPPPAAGMPASSRPGGGRVSPPLSPPALPRSRNPGRTPFPRAAPAPPDPHEAVALS